MRHFHPLLLALFLCIFSLSSIAEVTKVDTIFTFSDDGVAVLPGTSTGYKIEGTAVTINASGTYVFTGLCSDGAIKVKKETKDVKLVLAGLNLTSGNTAPLCCNSGSQVNILLQDGTSNTLADNVSNNDEAYPDNENAENAVIKLKKNSQVAIYGTGSLTVVSQGKNGIKSGAEAQLRIQNADISITTTVNDAISVDNLFLLESGKLNIVSASEGIKCEPDTTEDTASLGKLVIYGGSISITSAFDAIDTAGPVIILDGTIDITTGGGSKVKVNDDSSRKGVKSAVLLGIEGGNFNMNCADDAFHTNASMLVTGGIFQIATSDDAFHSDTTLVIGEENATTGPDITISACYEGLEAAYIYLCSGNIDITASDDGVNAANSKVSDHKLAVYGGNIICNASGDGFDSNNLTLFYGGDIQIFGSANGGNAALDSDGTIACYGGTIIAVGYSEMAQAPLASASTQSSVTFGSSSSMIGGPGGGQPGGGQPGGGQWHFGPGGGGQPGGGGSWGNVNNLSIAAGNTIVVMDASNNTLYSTTAVKTANNVVFSSEALVAGSTYYLYVNGNKAAQATAQSTKSGSYTKLAVPEIVLDYTALEDLPALEEETIVAPVRDTTLLTFANDGVNVSLGPDSAYAIDGTKLTFTGAGTYEITGTCSDGWIAVAKDVTDITLIFNGLTLSSSDTAAVLLAKNTDVTLNICGNNALADSETNGEDDHEKAVIKGKANANLTIEGSGSLTIIAKGKNGMKTGKEGTLSINGPTLTVNAPNDAISADHSLIVNGGTFKLTAEGDGIKAEPDEDDSASLGTITIHGGDFNIQAGDDGIQSSGSIIISGGDIAIQAQGCGINCGKDCTLAADTETPRVIITASSTAIKASAFIRSNAILHATASKSGIVAGSISLGEGSTELFVANEEEAISISDWTLSAGTLFLASNIEVSTSASANCLNFQGTANAQDAIAITDAEGNTLLSTIATQGAGKFLFADASLVNNGTFTLWLNNAQVDTYSFDSEVSISLNIPHGWSMIYLLAMPNDDALAHLHFYAYQDNLYCPAPSPILKKPYFVYNDGDAILIEANAMVSPEIHLESGWNFVGIPLETSLNDAISAWEWNGSAFTPVTTGTLTPGKAYWVKQEE